MPRYQSIKKRKTAYDIYLDQRSRGVSNIYYIAKQIKVPYPTVHSWVKEWDEQFNTHIKSRSKFLNFLKRS